MNPATTKFVQPPLPPTLVRRPELVSRLDKAVDRPVTVVAGSPGFGKTVLLAEWHSDQECYRVAWLTCDSWDNDVIRLWTSIASALSTVRPEIGADALDLLSEGPEAIDDVVASLINGLSQSSDPVCLVIDDLHVVPFAALDGLSTFCERLPNSAHVVIGSRADPLLPLHRWRARGMLSEVRDADLRLLEREVAAMTTNFGLRLSAEEVAILTRRTEGWAVGVQLAALSLQRTADQASFIRTFAGSQHLVVDFLIGEVLARQPLRMVSFLKATSVVEDFDVDLAGVLAECEDAGALLREAEAAALFLVPLGRDSARFRYHQLFRDLLRAQLASEDPVRTRSLHLRAGEWCESHGDFTQAVDEFIQAGEPVRAFDVLHDHVTDAFFGGSRLNIGIWLERLPKDALALEADRMLDYAFALGLLGRLDEFGEWLMRAGEAGDPTRGSPFRVRLEAVEAFYHALRGEPEPVFAFASGTFRLVERGSDPVVDEFPSLLARIQLHLGELDLAIETCAEHLLARPGPTIEVSLRGVIGRALFEKGELIEAEIAGVESMRLARDQGFAGHIAMFETVLTLGALALEHGDFDEAERLIEDALARSECVRPPYELIALVELAEARRARAEFDAALSALERARHALPPEVASPFLRRVDTVEARIRMDVGDFDRASTLAERLPPSPSRALVEAASLLGSGQLGRAQQSLAKYGEMNHLGVRLELERLLLGARIAYLSGLDVDRELDRAIDLGRMQNFGLTLVGGDHEISAMVVDRLRRSPRDTFTDGALVMVDRLLPGATVPPATTELLSKREQRVLRYLPTRLTTREIASELYISMNTLKSHLKSIYRKLDASSRGDAVARAKSLGLL